MDDQQRRRLAGDVRLSRSTAGPGPAHLDDGPARPLVVFHLHVVIPGRHGPGPGPGRRAVVGPEIDHEHVVHPESHAVVADGRERLGARQESEPARPPDGEVVVRDAAPRSAVPPAVVDRTLAAREYGRAGERAVAEVLGLVLSHRAAG